MDTGDTLNDEYHEQKCSGNFNQVREIITQRGKAAGVADLVSLNWILALRNQKKNGSVLSNSPEKEGEKNQTAREYSDASVPAVYFKEHSSNNRQEFKQYEYNGNFDDIRHLTVRQKDALNPMIDSSTTIFAT